MKNCRELVGSDWCDAMNEEDGVRNENREIVCVVLIIVVGTAIGCLFVAIRESLGMKM
jgi:hypothetical protein